MWLEQSVFERVVVIVRLTVWYRWNPTQIFTCELVWNISGLNLVWKFSNMTFFIHEIGVNFLSGMFILVSHVKLLICIHFKHVSGVNQVWNRPNLRRIFCTGIPWSRLGKLIGDQGIVYKIGPGNCHWSAFAEKCINNRTIRHDTKGWSQSCIVSERCTFWEVSRMQFILFLCFYLGWSAYLKTMSKIGVWPYNNGYMTGTTAS